MSGRMRPLAVKVSLRVGCAALFLGSAQISKSETLDTIVVTASRSAEPASRSGSSVTVIPSAEIDRTGTRGLADVLRGVAGLEVREAGGAGTATSVTVRGSSPGQTLVLVDGIRVGDPSAIDGSFDFGNLSLSNIERIEILRGPQSALYGSDAMGGVINIITRYAAGDPRRSVSVTAGSYGTIQSRASVSGGTDQLSYTFGLDALHTDGFPRYGYRIRRALTTGDGVTPLPALPWGAPTNRGGLTGRVAYRLSDTTELEIGLSGSSNAIRFANPFALIASNVFSPRNHSRADLLHGFARIKATALDGALVNQLTLFGNQVDRNIWQTEGCFDAFFTAFDCRSGYRGQRSGLEYQGDLKTGSGTAILGLRTETETMRTSQAPAPAGSFTALNARQTTNSIFAQHRWTLDDRLDLLAGGRLDAVTSGKAFATWRASASYRLIDTGTRFHGSIGTGAKTASLFQRYGAYGSSVLAPEESLGVDFGVEQQLMGDRLTLGATSFFNSYRNLIGFGFSSSCSPAQFLGCYYNVGRAMTRGVEVSANAILFPDVLRLRGTYTFLDARDLQTGVTLFQRPRSQAMAAVVFNGLRDVEAEARMTFVGARLDFGFPAVRLPAYVKWDMSASYKISQEISAFVRLENITNVRYEEIRNFGTAGRSVYAGLKVSW
jgi:vitamin B12 transporter